MPLAHGVVLEIGIGSGQNIPHYNPNKVSKIIGVDPNEYIWKRSAKRRAGSRTALDTSTLQVARARRDAMVEADDQYWAHLAFQNEQRGAVDVSQQRYEAARTRAKARGFIYTPLPELTATIDVADLLKRLSHAARHEPEAAEVEAVMGAVPPVSDSIANICPHRDRLPP